jgi:hypothetical protein
MTKLKSKPTGINPIQQAMIFENHAKTVRCDQVYRELVKNSLEACERQKRKDPNFKGSIQVGRLNLPNLNTKFSCMDNGDGMPKDRIVDLVNTLAETGEQSEDGNFGYGTKVSAYARNKDGIQYQSWHRGESEGSYVRIHKQKEGYYGAEPFEETNEHRLNLDLNQRPDFIIKNGGTGSIVSLLGQKVEEDTTKIPEDYLTNSLLCGRGSDAHWLVAKLNATFFSIPEYINLNCRANENTFRKVNGHKYYLDYYSKPEERGTINLTGAKLYYWIVQETDGRNKAAQDTSLCLVKSHLGFMHKKEMIRLEYNRVGMKSPLKEWGLTFSHKKIVLIIEPLNHTPDEKRVTLFGPDGREYRDLIPMWREEFQEKMPKCISDLEQKLMKENTDKEMDLTSLFRKISKDLKQFLEIESGELQDQIDLPLMVGGDRNNSGKRKSNEEGEEGALLKESFGKNPYRASIIGEDNKKRVKNSQLNMCPRVHRRNDMEDYELDYDYNANELSFNLKLKIIDEYVQTIKPNKLQADLVKDLVINDMIQSLVTRIAYIRGRSMGLSEDDKKECLNGNSLLMSLQDKFNIVERVKRQMSNFNKLEKSKLVWEITDNSQPQLGL